MKFHSKVWFCCEKAISRGLELSTVVTVRAPHSLCSHLFQLVPRKTSVLVLRAPIVLKSHLLRICSFWQWRVCVKAWDLCIQETGNIYSESIVLQSTALFSKTAVHNKSNIWLQKIISWYTQTENFVNMGTTSRNPNPTTKNTQNTKIYRISHLSFMWVPRTQICMN